MSQTYVLIHSYNYSVKNYIKTYKQIEVVHIKKGFALQFAKLCLYFNPILLIFPKQYYCTLLYIAQ